VLYKWKGISENQTPAIPPKIKHKKKVLNWEFQEIAVVSQISFLVGLMPQEGGVSEPFLK